jgi:hypothetical protein
MTYGVLHVVEVGLSQLLLCDTVEITARKVTERSGFLHSG